MSRDDGDESGSMQSQRRQTNVRKLSVDVLSEWRGMGDSNMSTFKRETSGLEQAEAEVEGEIRELVRHDIADLRRPSENDSERCFGTLWA